jgi:hypothetical protein
MVERPGQGLEPYFGSDAALCPFVTHIVVTRDPSF